MVSTIIYMTLGLWHLNRFVGVLRFFHNLKVSQLERLDVEVFAVCEVEHHTIAILYL